MLLSAVLYRDRKVHGDVVSVWGFFNQDDRGRSPVTLWGFEFGEQTLEKKGGKVSSVS